MLVEKSYLEEQIEVLSGASVHCKPLSERRGRRFCIFWIHFGDRVGVEHSDGKMVRRLGPPVVRVVKRLSQLVWLMGQLEILKKNYKKQCGCCLCLGGWCCYLCRGKGSWHAPWHKKKGKKIEPAHLGLLRFEPRFFGLAFAQLGAKQSRAEPEPQSLAR